MLDVAPSVPATADRRNMVVYELEGPSLVFASQRYPAAFTGDSVYLPGVCRTDSDGAAIEINRTIERNAFKAGVTLHVAELEKKRNLLLTDANGHTVAATIRNTPVLSPATATPGQFCHLVIELDFEGSLTMGSDSSVLLGNVAPASHGETVRNEILGQRRCVAGVPAVFAAEVAAHISSRTDRRRHGEHVEPAGERDALDGDAATLRTGSDGSGFRGAAQGRWQHDLAVRRRCIGRAAAYRAEQPGRDLSDRERAGGTGSGGLVDESAGRSRRGFRRRSIRWRRRVAPMRNRWIRRVRMRRARCARSDGLCRWTISRTRLRSRAK